MQVEHSVYQLRELAADADAIAVEGLHADTGDDEGTMYGSACAPRWGCLRSEDNWHVMRC